MSAPFSACSIRTCVGAVRLCATRSAGVRPTVIEIKSSPPSFNSAVTPSSGFPSASTCAPIPSPNTSTVTSQPSCCRLKLSKNPTHSSRGISLIGNASPRLLNAGRECLRYFTRLPCLPTRGALQRLDRSRLVEMNDGIELLWQPRVEVVTLALRLRAVDDPDGALQPRLYEASDRRTVVSQGEQESRNSYLMKQSFITFRQRGPDAFALGGRV